MKLTRSTEKKIGIPRHEVVHLPPKSKANLEGPSNSRAPRGVDPSNSQQPPRAEGTRSQQKPVASSSKSKHPQGAEPGSSKQSQEAGPSNPREPPGATDVGKVHVCSTFTSNVWN